MSVRLKVREALINELFEGKGLPFEITYQFVKGNSLHCTYEFTVPNEEGDYVMVVNTYGGSDGDTVMDVSREYGMGIYDYGLYLSVSFKVKNSDNFATINKGDVFDIMNTVKSTVLNSIEFGKTNGLELMMIYSLPTSNYSNSVSENTREQMYNYLYKKFKTDSFEFFKYGSYSGIYNTAKPERPPQEKLEKRQQTKSKAPTESALIQRINDVLARNDIFIHQSTYTGDKVGGKMEYRDYDTNIEYVFKYVFTITYDNMGNSVEYSDLYPDDEITLKLMKERGDEFVNLVK